MKEVKVTYNKELDRLEFLVIYNTKHSATYLNRIADGDYQASCLEQFINTISKDYPKDWKSDD